RAQITGDRVCLAREIVQGRDAVATDGAAVRVDLVALQAERRSGLESEQQECDGCKHVCSPEARSARVIPIEDQHFERETGTDREQERVLLRGHCETSLQRQLEHCQDGGRRQVAEAPQRFARESESVLVETVELR